MTRWRRSVSESTTAAGAELLPSLRFNCQLGEGEAFLVKTLLQAQWIAMRYLLEKDQGLSSFQGGGWRIASALMFETHSHRVGCKEARRFEHVTMRNHRQQ